MAKILLMFVLVVSSAFADLDYKKLLAAKQDQPPAVTTTESIAISVQYGNFEIPKGSTVKVTAFKPDGVLEVEYNGQKYSISVTKTDLEKRVAEIRGHRIIIDGVEYEDFVFSNPTIADVTIKHRNGVNKVLLSKLPPDLQKQYGYDPAKVEAYEAEKRKLDREHAKKILAENGLTISPTVQNGLSVKHDSYAKLLQKAKTKATNLNYTQNQTDELVSKVPEGGTLFLHITRSTIGAADLQYFTIIVFEGNGKEIARRQGVESIDSIAETPISGDMWWNIMALNLPAIPETPIKIRVVDGLANKAFVFEGR